MAPVTAAGRALGGVVAVLGIGMFALPAGLLGAAFVDELGKLRAARGGSRDGHAGHADGAHCPHCGKALGR
jgi:voltage-gated potassium channel